MKDSTFLGIFSTCIFLSMGCSHGLKGKIDALSIMTKEAEKNGAMYCAPIELAQAESELQFASMKQDQGDLFAANQLIDSAQIHAQTALDFSSIDHCTERAVADCDSDGILDMDDSKCRCEPETWNGHLDEDGCPDEPDTDGDLIPDLKDFCSFQQEDFDQFEDEDGCPEVDNDLDGVVDPSDKNSSGKTCMNDPEDPDGYEDGDGCPDPDNDGDSILDVSDFCPLEPGPSGGDKPGCPLKPSLVVVTDKEIKIKEQIHFQLGKDTIRSESFPILDAVVAVLKQNEKMVIEVQGHTDNLGSKDMNKKLSDRRAASVVKYLVSHGIEKARLTSKGYGMEVPIASNHTEANRALNRRVQFVRKEIH